MTAPRISLGPVYEYQQRLVRALMVCESFTLGEDQVADLGHIHTVLQDSIYPMILEWSNLPFLPPAELLVLFDRFAVPAEQIEETPPTSGVRAIWTYFATGLADRDGHLFVSTIEGELQGLSRTAVRQAVRARALAILCPTPRLAGSFTASIPELRLALKSDLNIGMHYHRILKDPAWRVFPSVLFASLDLDWMADQLRSWDRASILAFLGGRLRKSTLKEEAIGGKIDEAARMLTGVLRTILENQTPKLDTVDALLDAIRSRPRGDLAEAVLRRVLPLVNVSDVSWAHQELPTGGYADISTRGTFDRLLISNLAYPEEEFVRRMSEGELLYYELEAPPATQPPKQFVLLDGSPATWGIPRLAGGAVALSVVNRARERRAEAQVFAAGRMDRPFGNLDRASGVYELLDHQRWEEDLRTDLRALADRVVRETKDHPTGADLFLCTEAGRLQEIHDWARSSELPSRVRLHVFASDQVDGRATLWRRDGGAFQALSTLSLAARDLLPEPPAAPAPAAPALTGIPATSLEVNWDWGSNVTCSAILPDGLALTGHENGEIHLWDAIRAIHLSHRITLPRPVVAIAASRDYAVAAMPDSVVSFAIRTGGFVPTGHALFPQGRGTIRAGWEPDQFFWWDAPSRLVEYQAKLYSSKSWEGMAKPPHVTFVVDPVESVVLWRDPDGRMLSFDRIQKRVVRGSRYHPVLIQPVRHRAVDPEGKVVVEMAAGASTAEVRWLQPTVASKPEIIERCQQPKAVSAAANRLISANTDSIWFWLLKERKLIKEIVSPRQVLVGVEYGCAEDASTENGLLLEFQGGSGLVLHWYPEEEEDGAVQVDPIINPGKKIYRSMRHGGSVLFRSRAAYPVRPGTGESAIPAGTWRLQCRSHRRIEFFLNGVEKPLVWFWFRSSPLSWVLASAKHTAGNALGSLIAPEGTLLLKNPARLARVLATGGYPDHA